MHNVSGCCFPAAAVKAAAVIKQNVKKEKKRIDMKVNLLFCIIEATPDSHVAWLWYSKRDKEITELVSIKSETSCTDLFVVCFCFFLLLL